MKLVIPIFIPHEGCRHSCVFCNQNRISGHTGKPVTPVAVQATVHEWLTRQNRNASRVQVAFYGGSFTGLDLERQEELLGAVVPFIQQGRVDGIRLSTRPDYIDPERVDLLRCNHVCTVELGVQSMDEKVLAAAGRGHSADDAVRAVELLTRSGMEVGIQLMVGLPGEDRRSIRDTVSRVCALRPDFVRIYPVLVVRDSLLARLYLQGIYSPLSLDMAVLMAAWMKKRFDHTGIRVVRMGLQAGKELEDAIIAGPWHPSFGELVNSRLMLNRTRKLLAGVHPDNPVRVTIHEKDQSVFRGMKSRNMKRLEELGLTSRFVLGVDRVQARNTVEIRRTSNIEG